MRIGSEACDPGRGLNYTLRHRVQWALARLIRRVVGMRSHLWWDAATFSPGRGHLCACGHRSWTEREHLYHPHPDEAAA